MKEGLYMIFSIENLLFLIIIIPAISAFIGLYIGMKNENVRNHFYTATVLFIFALVCSLYPYVRTGDIHFYFPGAMGTGLYLKLDMLRYVLVFITSFLWVLSHIFSTHYLLKYKHRNRYYMFFILTLANTLGVFMSEHILNMFTFFELMTVTSYFLVIHDEDEYTHKAGNIYIAMSIAGGLVQLMGIFLLYNYTSTLQLSAIASAVEGIGFVKYIIAILIIIGFGVKACMFPLHIWLPKVYPPTPSPATALFSGVLTKTGIFGILITLQFMAYDMRLSAFILGIGLINMFIGGFLAIHHRNIKKVFAYSSMSQIGYILFGIGLIGLLKDHSYNMYFGTIFHMINHALLKTLLFFGSGVIFMFLQKLSLNEIKGYGADKPILKITMAVGFLGTIGLPGFNGFASKNMLHHGIAEASSIFGDSLTLFIEIIFLLSSAFTVAYLLKIFMTLFTKYDHAHFEDYEYTTNKHALFPMILLSIITILIGIKPGFILQVIGYTHVSQLHFYTTENILNTFFILVMGLFIYFFYVNKQLKVYSGNRDYTFINPTYEWFDLEKDLYTPILSFLFRIISLILYGFDNVLVFLFSKLSAFVKYISSIEFYKDISYYNRLVSVLFALKLRRSRRGSTPIPDIYKTARSKVRHHNKAIEREKTNLSKNLNELSYKLSSITYSIIVFALILALLLVLMLIL